VEGTLGANIAISHVDASLLSGGFEKPDVRCPDQPGSCSVELKPFRSFFAFMAV
jgi:hypothetical protein